MMSILVSITLGFVLIGIIIYALIAEESKGGE